MEKAEKMHGEEHGNDILDAFEEDAEVEESE